MLYQNDFYYLGLIVLMPLIGAIINGVFGAKLPKKLVGFIACGSILTSFFFTLVSIMALVANGQGEGAKKVDPHQLEIDKFDKLLEQAHKNQITEQ